MKEIKNNEDNLLSFLNYVGFFYGSILLSQVLSSFLSVLSFIVLLLVPIAILIYICVTYKAWMSSSFIFFSLYLHDSIISNYILRASELVPFLSYVSFTIINAFAIIVLFFIPALSVRFLKSHYGRITAFTYVFFASLVLIVSLTYQLQMGVNIIDFLEQNFRLIVMSELELFESLVSPDEISNYIRIIASFFPSMAALFMILIFFANYSICNKFYLKKPKQNIILPNYYNYIVVIIGLACVLTNNFIENNLDINYTFYNIFVILWFGYLYTGFSHCLYYITKKNIIIKILSLLAFILYSLPVLFLLCFVGFLITIKAIKYKNS